MLHSVVRSFSTARCALSKATSHRVIIPPPSHFIGKSSSFASSIPRHEYRQLPEESNYLEKFYEELNIFSKELLEKELNKSYADFENDPEELIFQLEKFIELQIIPKHSEYKEVAKSTPLQLVQCKTYDDKLAIQRFLDFARGVKKTLMFNGGHTFIFDIMLQAKDVFDNFQVQMEAKNS